MNRNLKRIALYIVIAATSLGAATVTVNAVSVRRARSTGADSTLSNNVAFRDGLYQGRLAAQRGAEKRVSVARWNAQTDRGSFVVGYQQAYEISLAANRQ